MSLGVIPARSQTQTPLPEVQDANPYVHHLESNSHVDSVIPFSSMILLYQRSSRIINIQLHVLNKSS